MTEFISNSLTGLLALRATTAPDQIYIRTSVPEDDGPELHDLTFDQTQKAVDRLADFYKFLCPGGSLPPVRVVSILIPSSLHTTLLELALCKLGLTPLLLSTNNSAAAVQHLMQETGSNHIIYGEKFKPILAQLSSTFEFIPHTSFSPWSTPPDFKAFPAVLTPDQERDRPGVILHSSGSTGFPKPVWISHYSLVANLAINQNMNAVSTLPVFHGYGHFAVFRCMYAGKRVVLFPGHLPLTCANIVRMIAQGEEGQPLKQCYAVPYVIKLMAEHREGVEALKRFDVVSYAGAPVPDDLGDRLTAEGVKLLSIFGTTETGSLMNSNRDFEADKFWNYVTPVSGVIPFITFEDRGKVVIEGEEVETVEVVVADGYPPKIQSNRPDGSYATKDLFMKKERQGRVGYRYIGRLDDTLVHTLGEKTNPVPMELAIRGNSDLVQEAIIFGAGRANTGCLILPSIVAVEQGYLNQDGTWDTARLMATIWPVIEKANLDAPSHSRLLPELIEFLPHETEIPLASKMTILRPACYNLFKDRIDAIYMRYSGEETVGTRVISDQPEMESYLLDLISRTHSDPSKPPAKKDDDLFAYGVDSLQATRMRNVLGKELDLSGASLGQNVVYEYPTVEQLAAHILAGTSGSSIQSEEAAMVKMVDEWFARIDFSTVAPSTTDNSGKVVLLTGATGSLGAHILFQLLQSPLVDRVVCISRAKTHLQSLDRVKESMTSRKLDLSEAQWGQVTSYAGDVNLENLGLTAVEYEGLRTSITDIICNAWPVNFILSLASYSAHVGGVINLINLSLKAQRGPASFWFSSSISCRQREANSADVDKHTVKEDFSDHPGTAITTGYGRSKWVVEKLCEKAGKTAGSWHVGVLRIGQMVGDSVHGIWNQTEAWPLMFKSAEPVGALPQTGEYPSWLPVDKAGKGIVEVLLAKKTVSPAIYHILAPNTSTSWESILDFLQSTGLSFKRVEGTKWVKILEEKAKGDVDLDAVPVLKLLPFFRTRYSGPSSKGMAFSAPNTLSLSSTLKDTPAVSKELVGKWVEAWRSVGFM
ncbi:L-aminoadipate-semialdehyde dehydrogenase [Mycena floridula]|nr:L-aminoadipate-semialdehyde dehydrogenase [Mycena floridula]